MRYCHGLCTPLLPATHISSNSTGTQLEIRCHLLCGLICRLVQLPSAAAARANPMHASWNPLKLLVPTQSAVLSHLLVAPAVISSNQCKANHTQVDFNSNCCACLPLSCFSCHQQQPMRSQYTRAVFNTICCAVLCSLTSKLLQVSSAATNAKPLYMQAASSS